MADEDEHDEIDKYGEMGDLVGEDFQEIQTSEKELFECGNEAKVCMYMHYPTQNLISYPFKLQVWCSSLTQTVCTILLAAKSMAQGYYLAQSAWTSGNGCSLSGGKYWHYQIQERCPLECEKQIVLAVLLRRYPRHCTLLFGESFS